MASHDKNATLAKKLYVKSSLIDTQQKADGRRLQPSVGDFFV